MNIDYFLNKFEALNNWCNGMLEDEKGNRCAMGHCDDIELSVLECLFHKHYSNMGVMVNTPITAEINDGLNAFMDFGNTSKERIMHALKLAKIKEEEEQLERRTMAAMRAVEFEKEQAKDLYHGELLYHCDTV